VGWEWARGSLWCGRRGGEGRRLPSCLDLLRLDEAWSEDGATGTGGEWESSKGWKGEKKPAGQWST
jgi:hypothetical protein